MKNLLILHLESINRERFSSFGSSFPNTRRLMQEALVFDNFFSSATSTLMAVSYLFYGNDFEFDAASSYEGMRPAENNRNLFSILKSRGYNTDLICLNSHHAASPTQLVSWPEDLPPVWGTNDLPTLLGRFDQLTDAPPFAIYVWNLITHIEHSNALAHISSGLTGQVRQACSLADKVIGAILNTLKRKGMLDNTVIVVYGDHGDDFWTHGFKGGMVHATEPYTQITRTPLAIRDSALTPGASINLASTIDIAPTCLALLGIDEPSVFPYSGKNLLARTSDLVFSQNFTANQPDNHNHGISKAFSAINDTYNLLVGPRGLELYAYHLDPGNHCNLLHFFNVMPDGRLALPKRPGVAANFIAALEENPRAVANILAHFSALHAALVKRVAAKREYIVAHGAEPTFALDPRCLSVIDDEARAAFFHRANSARSSRAWMPAFDFAFRNG